MHSNYRTEKDSQPDREYQEFKRRCGIQLNIQQDVAVQTVEGPVLLLAVPGSGKTTVLVARLGYMVYVKQIDPANILTVTYTVAATADMKRRFVEKFGEEYADALEFRTINGICQKILGYFGWITGKKSFDVADKQVNDIIKLVFRNRNDSFATEVDIKNISTAISYVKNMRLNQEEIDGLETDVENFPEIYKEYNAELRRRSLIDYDDQMVYALMILEKYPEVLAHFQNTYRYICVDEAQDTSKIQHDIINLLAAKSNNLFMVGDEDQSIYGFRAAYPQGLLDFEKIHQNAKVLLMESNYRSNDEIVRKADQFIQKNKYRHAKKMNATRSAGGCVKNISLGSRKSQYNYLLKVAQNCKVPTAVLYRNNESVIPIIDLFERNGIPFRIKKSEMVFFTHPVVNDIVDILKFARNQADGEIFLRIYYKIGASIKKTYAQQMVDKCTGDKSVLTFAQDIEGMPYYTVKSCKEAAKNLRTIAKETAGNAMYLILQVLGYQEYMSSHNMDSGKADILRILANNCESVPDFLDRLMELQNMFENGVGDSSALFILSTIHSSKGLEYDTVYLMDMIEGQLPAEGKPKRNASEAEKMMYEEERRLFYVAMTRAKNELYIFTFKGEKNSCFSSEVFQGERASSTDNSYGTGIVPGNNSAVPVPRIDVKKSMRQFDDVLSDGETERRKLDFEMGVIVRHRLYGRGVIVERKDDTIDVLFDSGKHKEMLLDYVVKKELLVISE